jgi:glycosyltransferase involved in cell wall biosynthesis
MRILHVIGRLDFADGGPPQVATRLAAGQAAQGHTVGLACYSCAADYDTGQQLSYLPGWNRVELHRLPRAGLLERLRGQRAVRALEPLIAAADVIHLHNVWEMILLRASQIARAMGKPYLVLPNGMLDPWSLEQKKWKKQVALAMGYRRMLDECAMLHLLNDSEQELIAPLNLKCEATIIPNGVNFSEIDPLPPFGQFIASHRELSGRRFVLFLSRLHYKKGLDYLADGFALLAPKHEDLDLVVAGPDGGERDNFQRRVAAAGLTDRVHIVGPLYGKEKFAALVDCDCFTLPSRQEGFSIAILEALAAGAPVVISTNCHFPEVAAAGAGEVIELNADALAAALDRVLYDPKRHQLGQEGRYLVESQYTWDRVARLSIEVYRPLCAPKTKPKPKARPVKEAP